MIALFAIATAGTFVFLGVQSRKDSRRRRVRRALPRASLVRDRR